MPELKPNAVEITDLLRAVDKELSAGRDKGDPTEQKLKVVLDDKDLWIKFKDLTNEMIVTKSGRRMFPVQRVSLSGLDPNAMYSFLLDFVMVDKNRWKYVNGEWVPGGKAEPTPPNAVYVHPDSPNFGAHWMKDSVSFSKVKLTNKMHGNGQIMLNSLHKYQPRLHIVRVGNGEKTTVGTYSFPETQFVAVTAYQNEEITALKIKHNPFAKAFQDAKERPDQRETGNLDNIYENEKKFSHFASPWFLPHTASTLVPHGAHQLQSSLALSCDRFSLRDHRHTPYPPSFSRRSPPHGAYPQDVTPNFPMLNFSDNWSHISAAGAHPGTVPHAGIFSPNSPTHQGQYAVWNLAPAVNQSCTVAQYTPYIRTTPTYTLPPTPDTPCMLNTTSDASSMTSRISSMLTASSEASSMTSRLYDHIQASLSDIDSTSPFTSASSISKHSKQSPPAGWSQLTPPNV